MSFVPMGCCDKCGGFWALTKGTCDCGGNVVDAGIDSRYYWDAPRREAQWKQEDEIRKRITEQSPNFDRELYEKHMADVERTRNKLRQRDIEEMNTNQPKCPTCGSTNIKHISSISRAGSIIMLGIFSGKIGKNYECLNCKARW